MHCSSIRHALASAFGLSVRSGLPATATRNTIQASSKPTTFPQHGVQFSTTTVRAAKKKQAAKPDKRITMIRYFLHHPTELMPRPLRFSRNRALRHWTIHRAWNLYRSKIKQARQIELERQYNAMAAANEELRLGAGDGGKLFRKAQMKTGVWSIPERGGGIPIEYSRPMVEWMGTTASMGAGNDAKIWDSNWKRQ